MGLAEKKRLRGGAFYLIHHGKVALEKAYVGGEPSLRLKRSALARRSVGPGFFLLTSGSVRGRSSRPKPLSSMRAVQADPHHRERLRGGGSRGRGGSYLRHGPHYVPAEQPSPAPTGRCRRRAGQRLLSMEPDGQLRVDRKALEELIVRTTAEIQAKHCVV